VHPSKARSQKKKLAGSPLPGPHLIQKRWGWAATPVPDVPREILDNQKTETRDNLTLPFLDRKLILLANASVLSGWQGVEVAFLIWFGSVHLLGQGH
jgi:hypothetical protein